MENLNYGIIGNCKSGALISENGSIDWLCLPQFDSTSVFAKILDKNKGGFFQLIPEGLKQSKQFYQYKTNILITRFECETGIFEIHDFMPRYILNDQSGYYLPSDLIRYIKLVDGRPGLSVRYEPRLVYARHNTKTEIEDGYIKSYTTEGSYDSVYLYTSFEKKDVISGKKIYLDSDNFFLLSYNQKLLIQTTERSYLKLQRTKVYWLNWSEITKDFSNYNDQINRSALTLKLLSYQKSGAVLAALTTSLPESVGGIRNWDYRFCWIRDASMVVKIMYNIGHKIIAKRYLKFINDIMPDKDEKMQIMYGIDGQKVLTEKMLDHLDGYMGSKPVRIGNAAYIQKQNDIYGILLDVIYMNFKIYYTSLQHSEELWTIVRNIVKVVERNWQLPDKGIWEIRNTEKHFTFSKVLCWAAIDRAVKIASLLNQSNYIVEWNNLRNTIHDDIMEHGWSEEKQAFTQTYGGTAMDASVLLMESYGFINATDPSYISTVKVIRKELEHNGLLYRYNNDDDFGAPKSAFLICSFWLVNSLFRIGEKEEARKKFNELLSYSNHLGLFSEDIDFDSKRLLGNFPQAYSHLALIETAITLSEGKVSDDEQILQMIH